MSIARHREVIRRYFDEVWNRGALDLLDELIHPDYVNRSPALPDPPPGPAGLKPIVAALRGGFPDLRYEVLHQVYEGDLAAIRLVLRGTQTGELFGRPPSGRRVEVESMQFERFTGGRIVEHWRRTDELTFSRQLGWD